MKKIKIYIEERVVQAFEVEANDIDEAMKIAEGKYFNGEFVLEPGEVQSRLISAEDPEDNTNTEWKEF